MEEEEIDSAHQTEAHAGVDLVDVVVDSLVETETHTILLAMVLQVVIVATGVTRGAEVGVLLGVEVEVTRAAHRTVDHLHRHEDEVAMGGG